MYLNFAPNTNEQKVCFLLDRNENLMSISEYL